MEEESRRFERAREKRHLLQAVFHDSGVEVHFGAAKLNRTTFAVGFDGLRPLYGTRVFARETKSKNQGGTAESFFVPLVCRKAAARG